MSVNARDNCGVRPERQTPAMTWETFDSRSASTAAQRGFELIGAAVRRRRHRLYVSQRVLGIHCGIDQSTISRLENGKLGGLRWSRFAVLVYVLGGLEPPEVGADDGHALATATMVERREGSPAVSRSPTRPMPNVGQ